MIIFSKLRSILLLALLSVVPAGVLADTPEPIRPTILVYGDSISAAYGIDVDAGWVSLLQSRLQSNELPYQVVNASVSGETTGGGVVRLPNTLDIHQPDLVVLELGGNDGLRGYPIDKIRQNLATMVSDIHSFGADVLLIGMVLPPNYGRRYTDAFQTLYDEIAAEFNVPFIPFLLEGVTTSESLLQRDGIHPTEEAQALLLEDIWPAVEHWALAELQ